MFRLRHRQHHSKRARLGLGLLLGLAACAPTGGDARSEAATVPGRIVAVGDLHGDLDASRRALRLAGAIDAQDHWAGGNLTLVQTGDQLDRGDGEIEILALFERLQTEAAAAGGQVHVLNGNHELMNVQGDFRYVTEQGFKRFTGLQGLDLSQPMLGQLPEIARPRGAAFLPGGPYARKLAGRKSVLVLAGNVFVHGGVLPAHVDYGLDRVNNEYQAFVAGTSASLPAILTDDNSPIWTRAYSNPQVAPACEPLRQALQKAGARRMIVGHSVQPEINSACKGQVWRIDVGMSKAYGGPIQVLEIQGDEVKVLKEGTGQ